MELTI